MNPQSHVAPRFLIAVLLCLAARVEPAPAPRTFRTTLVGAVEGGNARTFDTNKALVLVFQTRALPANATITAATLQLTASSMLDAAHVENIRVSCASGCIPPPTRAFAGRSFNREQPGKNGVARWEGDAAIVKTIRGGDPLTLRFTIEPVGLDAGVVTREWHSSGAEKVAWRPRLVVDYTIADRPIAEQAIGLPAVQSPTAFLPTVTGAGRLPDQTVHVRPFTAAKALSFAPAFANGLVYTLEGDSSKQVLQPRAPFTGDPIPFIPVGGAGRYLVASPPGRLYVVGDDHVYVYKLDPSKPGSPVVSAREPLPVSGLRPQVAPGVGPDGSLYVFNNGQLLAFNPDLEQLWSLSMPDTRIGPLTVSPTGRFIYFVAAAPGKRATGEPVCNDQWRPPKDDPQAAFAVDGLVAVDTATGQALCAALPNQKAVNTFPGSALHAPVVTLGSDGTDRIVASADGGETGGLALFGNPRNGAAEEQLPLNPLWTHPGDAGWSQVLPIAGAAPFVGLRKDGAIVSVQTIANVNTAPTTVLRPGTLAAASLDGGVWTASGRPVVDRAGALLLWTAGNALRVFPGSGNATVLKASGSQIADTARLGFGSDGTLYALTPDDRGLYVVVPQIALGGQSVTVDSATHLRVSGSGGNGTVLTASGTITIAQGTKLSSGTTIRMRQAPRP